MSAVGGPDRNGTASLRPHLESCMTTNRMFAGRIAAVVLCLLAIKVASQPSESECPEFVVPCDHYSDCAEWFGQHGWWYPNPCCAYFWCNTYIHRCVCNYGCLETDVRPCCSTSADCYAQPTGEPIYPAEGEAFVCAACMCLNVSIEEQSFYHPEEEEEESPSEIPEESPSVSSECPEYEVPCEDSSDCTSWMDVHCPDWPTCCSWIHCNEDPVNHTCGCLNQCQPDGSCCATAADCYDGSPGEPPVGMAYVCVACSCCLVPIEEQSYYHPEESPSEISEESPSVSSECPVPTADCNPEEPPENYCGAYIVYHGLGTLFAQCSGGSTYTCPDCGTYPCPCSTGWCVQNASYPCCLDTPDCYSDPTGQPVIPAEGEAFACIMCMCLNVSIEEQSYWHGEESPSESVPSEISVPCEDYVVDCETDQDCVDWIVSRGIEDLWQQCNGNSTPDCVVLRGGPPVPGCHTRVECGHCDYPCCCTIEDCYHDPSGHPIYPPPGEALACVMCMCVNVSLDDQSYWHPEEIEGCCETELDCLDYLTPVPQCYLPACLPHAGGLPYNCCGLMLAPFGTPCFEMSLQTDGICDGDGNCVAEPPQPPIPCCTDDLDCQFANVPQHGCIYHLCETSPGGAPNCCVPHLKPVGTPCDDENPMTNDSVCNWNGTCVGVCPEWPYSEFPSESEGDGSQSHWHPHHPHRPFCGHGWHPAFCKPCPGCNSCPPCPQCPQCPQCPPPCPPPQCPDCPQCPQCPTPPGCPECPVPPGCPECPECPDPPQCPTPPECPECNPPECPDCPPPPQCPDCPECPDCNPPQCPQCPECPDCPPPPPPCPPPRPPCPPPCPGPQCEQDDDCGIAPQCYRFDCSQHVCVLLMETTGAICHDGDPCTINDVCDGYGRCAGTKMDCDDDDPCTRDWCQAGNCRNSPIPNCGPGPSCPEPEPQCTTDESCGYAPQCHHFECIDGQCVLLIDQIGTDCDDGDACTRDDECDGYGRCIGRERRCDDEDPCTDDRCEDGRCYNSPIPGCTRPCESDQDCGQSPYQCETYSCISGHCVPLHDPTGSPCDDGNICTTGDACDPNGRCIGICNMCDDQNPCTEDACHPLSGCSHYPILNCVGPCTQDADCPPSPNPCMMPSCQQDGTCTFVPKDRMTPCDDGNPCTEADKCDGEGSCVGICGPGICDDQDPCTVDTCHPVTGCAHEAIPNCLGPCSTPADCPQPCSDCFYATCSSEGVCGENPKRPGSPCDDGLPWTTGDACDGQGNCVPEEEDGCDDGLPETDDYYDYRTQTCVHVERLELLPWCSNVTCEEDADCRTDRPCLHGACLYEVCCYLPDPTGQACDDGNECTTGDHCHAGACVPDGWDDCDDSDGCTTDRCVPGEGCSHDEVPNCLGPCTHDDNCSAIAPVSPCLRPVCTDGHCSWEELSDVACDDSNPCTHDDTCVEGDCVGTPVDCDDQDPCTKDVCDLESGCTHEPIPGCSCVVDGAAGSLIPIILLVGGVGGAGVIFLFLLARPVRGAFGRAEMAAGAGRPSTGAHPPAPTSRPRKRVDQTI